MSPCSPSPLRPALAASATVARFQVSTEIGGGGCLFLTREPPGTIPGGPDVGNAGEESMVGQPGLEG